MNLKGGQRAGGVDQAVHLLNRLDNDEVEVIEIRGTVAKDVLGFMSETEAIASGTRCKKPFYSLSISPPVPLTAQQYTAAIASIESELGLSGQPRVIIRHVKKGREHYHVVWSRIDFRTMTAVHISHDRFKLQKVRKELAAKFGYALPQRLEEKLNHTLAENAQAAATGITPQERSFDITEAYMASDTGQAFIHALAELGYTVAQGDKRVFVIVDRYGYVYSLSRQIKGVRTKHIREKLAPLDPMQLPTVDQVVTQDTKSPPPEIDTAKFFDELKDIHFRRRALFDRDATILDRRQDEEFTILRMAQAEELSRPFLRLVSAVYKLFSSYPAFRSVFGHIHKLTHLKMAERHRLELEALARRHNREWFECKRKNRYVGLLENRERQSLKLTLLRKQRISERKRHQIADAFLIDAHDITAPGPLVSPAESEPFDPVLAAIERKYSADYVPLRVLFHKAAALDNPADDDGDSEDRPPPSLSNPFNCEH